MLELAGKDFKVAILTAQRGKVKMFVLDERKILAEKQKKHKKKNPLKILELKNSVSELKNSLDGLNRRMEMTKERKSP